MQQYGKRAELESSRNEKIKELGYISYNLNVDGNMVYPEIGAVITDIKEGFKLISDMRQRGEDSAKQEEYVDGQFVALGCICYNLYIDNKLTDERVKALCNEIFVINKDIEALNDNENCALFEEIKEEYSFNEEHKDFFMDCPSGMEPVPDNYKMCVCGYKNRAEAKFCGRCGKKLP